MSEVLAKFQELIKRGYKIGSYSQKRDGYEYEFTSTSDVTLKIPVKAKAPSLDDLVKSVFSTLKSLGYYPDKPTISGNAESVSSDIWTKFQLGHVGKVSISSSEICLSVNSPGKHLARLAPYLDKLIEDNKGN
jgi:hypothetical protein